MEHKILEQSKKPSNCDEDLIDFYLQPEFIQMIAGQLAGQPQVDFKKVAQIKQAILDKSLVIDELSLAEKIINFESELSLIN